MIQKKILSIALSSALAVSIMGVGIVSAEDTEQTTAIGTASLQIGQENLAGDDIYGNGQYDMTWEIPDDVNVQEAQTIRLKIEHTDYGAFGQYGDVNYSIDELWLDGVKAEGISGQLNYAIASDYAFGEKGVTGMFCTFRGEGYNDITTEVYENIRIVFTLSNVTNITMDSEKTTTTTLEEGTVTETETTTTVEKEVLTATPTTPTKKTSSSPATGNEIPVGVLSLFVLSGGTAVCLSRRTPHND
ncbi:hypothetical protein [uncultured Ruminococcus sp.]|uniref:hypothetical protein n=1 Tax=uncultured Ruminococcus sp. TaxID=165186 RepID=UPI00262CFF17|nr:hypothetical protein [uncultured Ruminococcus sp.]